MCLQKGDTRPEETKKKAAEETKKKLLRKVSSAATCAEEIRGVKSAFAEETFICFRQF